METEYGTWNIEYGIRRWTGIGIGIGSPRRSPRSFTLKISFGPSIPNQGKVQEEGACVRFLELELELELKLETEEKER